MFIISSMKRHVLMALVIAVLALAPVVSGADFDDSPIPGLNVTTDIDDAFDASESENRTLMIVFDQDGCVYCDIFKSEVLSDLDVQKVLNDNFTVLLVDVNRNPDIASKYLVYGTPSIVFVDSNGTDIDRIDGCPQADEFLDFIKGI